MAIITLEEYKAYAGVKNPERDAKLGSLVSFVNNFIQKYCNISTEPTVVLDARVTSDDGLSFLLPVLPVTSVTAVTVDGVDLSEDDYIVDYDVGFVESLSSFPTKRNGILVDYTHGAEEAPHDLKVAAFELVTYYSKGNFNTNQSSSTGESASMPTPEIIPTHVRMILDMHKA